MAMRREKVTLMKSVAVAMCLIAASAFAQDRPTALEIANSARKPTIVVRANVTLGDPANPAIVRLKGDVQIAAKNPNQKNGGMSVKADEAVYHFDTGEIEPLGNVRVKRITQSTE